MEKYKTEEEWNNSKEEYKCECGCKAEKSWLPDGEWKGPVLFCKECDILFFVWEDGTVDVCG
jgi:hypothetical protein